ncbi:MAG: DUF4139 domain-containing protein [Bacteroidia bacterium]
MRNILFAIAICSSLITVAQTNTTEARSEIKKVTVFLSGAQITQEANINLKVGSNLVKLIDITANLDVNSLQISGNKNITIVSVNHQFNYLAEPKKSKRFNEIKDSLDDVNLKLNIRRSMRMVYTEEKNLLLANKTMGGAQNGVIVEDVMEMAEYFRTHLNEIELKLIDIQLEEQELTKQQQRLQQQLNQLSGQTHRNTSEILVNISSKTATTAKLQLSYHVHNAGWIPFYDIRSNALGSAVELNYKANVHQTTGYDWNNVDITLSTGNPSINNNKPNVYPWILQYYQEYNYDKKNGYGYAPVSRAEKSVAANELEEVNINMDSSGSLANFTQVVEAGVNTEFKISVPYSVSTDGTACTIEIQKHDLESGYKYYTAPKYNTNAFLVADVTGWDKLNLLPGESNIFYEGTYVGKAYINPNVTEDTLQLSLGADKGIVVERKKVDGLCKKQTIGGSKKTTSAFEISVRNTKNKEVEMVIEDQVPLSRQKDIEVTLDEKSGNPEYNAQTGSLKWKVKIAPGETVKVQFTYTVKHPKDKVISNL